LGRKFYTVGFKTLFRGHPNMDSLIALGTSAAFIYSLGATIGFLLGYYSYAENLYYESAAVILTLITLGEYLVVRSMGATSAAIGQLMVLAPKEAIALRYGKDVDISMDDVVVGDTIIAKPGQKVAVDGVFLEGKAIIQESMLTGERIAAVKTPGENV